MLERLSPSENRWPYAKKILKKEAPCHQLSTETPDGDCVWGRAGPPPCGIHIDSCTISPLQDAFLADLTLKQVTLSPCCMNCPLLTLPI